MLTFELVYCSGGKYISAYSCDTIHVLLCLGLFELSNLNRAQGQTDFNVILKLLHQSNIL